MSLDLLLKCGSKDKDKRVQNLKNVSSRTYVSDNNMCLFNL